MIGQSLLLYRFCIYNWYVMPWQPGNWYLTDAHKSSTHLMQLFAVHSGGSVLSSAFDIQGPRRCLKTGTSNPFYSDQRRKAPSGQRVDVKWSFFRT